MSNTIKIIANRKNRIENGIRALWLGSNPHSNGDAFSREDDVGRIDSTHAKPYTIPGRAIATEDAIRIFIIIQKYIYYLLIKNQVLKIKLSE